MSLNIIIVLGICFVIENLLLFYTRFPILNYFALTPKTLTSGWLWQLITFNFLHAPFGYGGFFHILFNCWGIWVFGTAVEDAIGPKRLLSLFLLTGVGGGLLQALGSITLPTHFGLATVGASAGVFGLIGAYAGLFPARQITMLLFFIIPVTITARFLLIFSGLVSVFGILVPTGGVAHGAHLGGLLAGVAFVRHGLQADWSLPNFKFWRRTPKVFTYKKQSPPSNWPANNPGPTDAPPEEFISREIDPILDKISAHGIQSLTEPERKKLEAARAKMARR